MSAWLVQIWKYILTPNYFLLINDVQCVLSCLYMTPNYVLLINDVQCYLSCLYMYVYSCLSQHTCISSSIFIHSIIQAIKQTKPWFDHGFIIIWFKDGQPLVHFDRGNVTYPKLDVTRKHKLVHTSSEF